MAALFFSGYVCRLTDSVCFLSNSDIYIMGIAVGIIVALVGFLLKKLIIPVIAAAASVVLWMVFGTMHPVGSVLMGFAFICCIASFPFFARLIALIPKQKA